MKQILFFTVLLFLSYAPGTEAASLREVKDLVSSSQVATSTNHTIEFMVTTAIPASGKITVRPEAGFFTIPAGFDVTDVDVAVSSGGSYLERTLAATASATEEGVTVVAGTSGSITVTLNSTTGVPSGERVRMRLGTNAVTGATGDVGIINPSTVGMYRMAFETFSNTTSPLDYGETRIAIIAPVAASINPESIAPVRSNGLPSGALSHNNSSIEISLNTNKPSTCRYATSTDVAYASMLGTFVQTNATLHTRVVTGHQNGTSYTYYVRCTGVENFPNTDDYPIAFSVGTTPTVLVSSGGTNTTQAGASGAGGGSGDFFGGSQNLFLSSVSFSAFSAPLGTYYLLKDGIQVKTAQISETGKFQTTLSSLERGAYTFALYVTDRSGNKSAVVTQTLSLGQGTSNNISNIIIPPTVVLERDSVPLGESVRVSGEAVPGASVELLVIPQGSAITLGGAQKYTATTTDGVGSSAGAWSAVVNTAGLARGTYTIKARLFYQQSESTYSASKFLGVGEAASPEFGARADINGDGKVNLIDFSIMLTSWGRASTASDINEDGTVNLADFSILLFNWTG